MTTLRQRLAQQPPDALAAKHACARARAALACLDSGGANSIYGGADGVGLKRGGAVVGVVGVVGAAPRVGIVGAGAGVPGVYIEQVEGVRRELEEVEAAVAGVLDVC